MNGKDLKYRRMDKVTLETPLVKVPHFFHDILGETVAISQVFLIFIGTALCSLMLWEQGMDQLFMSGLNFKALVVALLSVDIIAGAIANLTKGTNDFYAKRPLNRLIFIGVHIQPLLLFWLSHEALGYALLGPEGILSVKLWLYVLVTGLIVNGFNSPSLGLSLSRRHQSTLAMLFVVLGIAGLIGFGADLAPWLQSVYAIFLIKVVYSFSVNHYPEADSGLSFYEMADLVEEAFREDPLYEYVRVEEVDRATFSRIICLKTYYLRNQLKVVRGEEGTVLGLISFSKEGLKGQPSWGVGLMGLVLVLLWEVLMGKVSLKGLIKMNRYMAVSEQLKPKAAHVYIHLIAVSPKAQGKGIGRALLEEAEAYAQSERITLMALDTEHKGNVDLYRHMGYSVNGSAGLETIEVFSCYKPL